MKIKFEISATFLENIINFKANFRFIKLRESVRELVQISRKILKILHGITKKNYEILGKFIVDKNITFFIKTSKTGRS